MYPATTCMPRGCHQPRAKLGRKGFLGGGGQAREGPPMPCHLGSSSPTTSSPQVGGQPTLLRHREADLPVQQQHSAAQRHRHGHLRLPHRWVPTLRDPGGWGCAAGLGLSMTLATSCSLGHEDRMTPHCPQPQRAAVVPEGRSQHAPLLGGDTAQRAGR